MTRDEALAGAEAGGFIALAASAALRADITREEFVLHAGRSWDELERLTRQAAEEESRKAKAEAYANNPGWR